MFGIKCDHLCYSLGYSERFASDRGHPRPARSDRTMSETRKIEFCRSTTGSLLETVIAIVETSGVDVLYV